jgi:hypothetical protein
VDPVPVSDDEAGELVALLVNEALAAAAPLACGENVMLKDTLWPAAIVRGNVKPLIENSEVVIDAPDKITLDPLAVSVAEVV